MIYLCYVLCFFILCCGTRQLYQERLHVIIDIQQRCNLVNYSWNNKIRSLKCFLWKENFVQIKKKMNSIFPTNFINTRKMLPSLFSYHRLYALKKEKFFIPLLTRKVHKIYNKVSWHIIARFSNNMSKHTLCFLLKEITKRWTNFPLKMNKDVALHNEIANRKSYGA